MSFAQFAKLDSYHKTKIGCIEKTEIGCIEKTEIGCIEKIYYSRNVCSSYTVTVLHSN